MNKNFQDFTSLSTPELEKCVSKRTKYSPEDVESAISELENRGRIFSFAELRAIEIDLKEMRRQLSPDFISPQVDKESFRTRNPFFESNKEISFKNAHSQEIDSNSPSYYSPSSISIFSILFSTIFGVILMAINFNKAQNKRGMWEVIGFGVVYMIIISIVINYFPHNYAIGIIFNGIGAVILYQFFWRRYIGDETIYRSKPIIKPLLISFIIVFALVALLVSMGVQKI